MTLLKKLQRTQRSLRFIRENPGNPSASSGQSRGFFQLAPPATGQLQFTALWSIVKRKGLTVLYVGGWGRSGSTILGQILGQVDGFFFVGELPEIWKVGVLENRYCACGKRFRECALWRAVFDRAFGGMDEVDAAMMVHYRNRGTRNRHIPLMLLPAARRRLWRRLSFYMQNVARLYVGIQEVTGCEVIVDSSKWPAYGRMLAEIPALDLYVTHLIRDARAVAYSWQRSQLLQPGTENPLPRTPYGVLASTYQWFVGNWATEKFWKKYPERYLRLNYEAFVARPQSAVAAILALLQKRDKVLPFTGKRQVALKPSHAVWGNPSRFQAGNITLQLDDEWQYNMRRADKALVTMLTLPLLYRYGYFSS